MIRISVWLVAVWTCLTIAQAQYSGNTRTKNILIIADTLSMDSLTIFKGTVKVFAGNVQLIEDLDYKIDYQHSAFIPLRIAKNQTVTVSYNVMMLPLGKEVSHKNRNIIQPYFQEIRNPYLYSTESKTPELYQSDGLKMNGSLSRGLSFGNNQDVVVNSNLNLQLAGKLSNDIDVLAAISDENNPIQPEGNTQQLQDFDKVYIQLSKNQTKLTVGDFEMTRPRDSYFMNYYKKSRGIQLYSSVKTGKNGTLYFGGEGALSRGRFARNIINGIEGNLGPYRLSGTNGELYIIIISGTESVYLDGEKLKRGEQNDYVIDYNTGEVTFMPKRIITQYSRIVVEFQYSDRNYARSVFHLNTEYETKNYRIRANYFSEQDSKNQPFLQNLTDSNKAILANVGDDINNALAPTAIATREFSTKKILYRQLDTLGFTGVFVYTDVPESDSIFYEVRFSLVGQGNGDYIQAQSSANGRVFQWVPPVGGIKQGSYAPVILLVSPKSMQMYTLGVDVNAIRNTLVSVEVARSEYDKNLFATKDKGNDAGYGVKLSITNVIPLQQLKENAWNIKTETQYEFVDQNFRYVERYRNVEFDRTWNRQLTNQPTADTGYNEHIVSLRTSLNKQSFGSTFYQIGYYDRAGLFNGLQQLTGTSFRFGRNIFSGDAEWIDTKNNTTLTTLRNDVKRYKADYARELFFLTSGVRYEYEESNYRKAQDSLERGSFAYGQVTFYTRNTDSTNLRYGAQYAQREDYQPRLNQYDLASLSRSVNANMEYTQKNFNRLSANFTYRDFEVRDTNFTKLKPERTILSRVEYDYAFLKRVFTANTYYQLGSGQELRRDFQFVEVPFGQGIYVWKDFDKDGTQALNEFVVASFSDRNQANYIKVFLPTNTTIRTNSNQFNQTLNINPNAVWNNQRGMKKFVSRWNNQTALRIDRKTTELSTFDFVNPFLLDVTDSTLISVASIIRNTLFFNRSDPTFGFDLNFQDNKSKTYLTNGFDSRAKQEKGINVRWNFTTMLGITIGYTYGNRLYSSDFFTDNNYNYLFDELKPRLIFQASRNLRATLLYTYFEGNNRADLGNQNGNNQEFGAELRYNIGKQGVLNSKFSLYKVSFDGDISSPLGYDMLQGLTIGNNMIWNIGFQQRLSNNLQINVSYDGRKSEGQPVVNIGRMEARYLF
ncbi:MAG: hypothetical protein V4590_12480 [Bacteroidota bacterium]